MEKRLSDAMLMELLQECKTITGFLDAVFGFLKRNTDFYYVQKDINEKIGFRRGMREEITMNALQRYDPENIENAAANPPLIAEEIEIYTTPMETEIGVKNDAINLLSSVAVEEETLPTFAPSEYKNGAAFANHCWSQTLTELELHLRLPTTYNAKNIIVDIKSTSIDIKSTRCEPQLVFLSGQFSQRVKPNDSVWTITDGRLLLTIDKSKELWWERLFQTDSDIDIKKIDSERYIDELPEESQAAIHKLRCDQLDQDQHRFMNTTQTNTATLEKLKKAWNAPDSPFRGQPFDPSQINLS